MKLYKSNSLIEEINNVGEFDKGLKGIAEVDFADAVIRTREKEKEINDTLEKHFTKDLKEIDNTEKDRTEPHKVTSPDLKKMHLSEALFEDWEEDESKEVVLEIYKDEVLDYTYTDQYQADAQFAELDNMTDPELNGRGIIGYARLSTDDDGNLYLEDTRYACDDCDISIVDEAIENYLENNNSDSELKENLAYKDDLKSKVYNALTDIAYYYHKKGQKVTPELFEEAFEWFVIKFFEDEYEAPVVEAKSRNLADRLRARIKAKKESMINEDLVIIAGVEDFKPSSELAQKVLDIVMQNDKLGEFDQICEKMFPEGAKSEDINEVLESEDGKWVIEMLDLDPSMLTIESETVEVTDAEVEA